MSNSNDPATGEMIQNYVRRKWRYREHWKEASPESPPLDGVLAERIDYLGIDDKLILDVEPDQVIQKIEELERRLAEEDRR